MPLMRELIVENARLKEEITQLKTERNAKSSADESRRTFADFGVQCELNQKQTKNFNRLNNFTVGKTFGTRKNKNIIKPKNTYQQPSTTSDNLSKVKSVTIEGDSHARHIAGLLAKQVGPATIVREFCKPGAKFLEVTATNSPPSDCLVLIAGTNDVAAGEQRNIATWRSESYPNHRKAD
ncbi:hypothetical protein J6590_059232 [Homalodisca vitripennis]|nr:hypothetical protein J6590_059232 [Homalodisca vitripennis]